MLLVGVLWFDPPTPVEIHGRFFHETNFEERADDQRFLIPYEHSLRTNRNPLWDIVDFFWGSDEEFLSLWAGFSAAWLSAHVDGFQPVLKDRLEGDIVLIWPTRDGFGLRPTDADLWYGRDYKSGRVVLEQREPNTGMQMIVYSDVNVIDPFSDEMFLFLYLIDTPPRPNHDYPLDPPWRVQVCGRDVPGHLDALGEELGKITSCAWLFHVIDGVTFNVQLSGENLSLHSEVGHAISREIMRWMLMAAKQPPTETP